jgi:hypothetical protein
MMISIYRFFYRIFFEHVKKLPPYEELCLNTWRNLLSVEEREILDKQLESCWTVRRYIGKLCFYHYRRDDVPLFFNQQRDLHVASIILETSLGKRMVAKIFLHRGLFFSIEFPGDPEKYANRYGFELNQLDVKNVEILADLSVPARSASRIEDSENTSPEYRFVITQRDAIDFFDKERNQSISRAPFRWLATMLGVALMWAGMFPEGEIIWLFAGGVIVYYVMLRPNLRRYEIWKNYRNKDAVLSFFGNRIELQHGNGDVLIKEWGDLLYFLDENGGIKFCFDDQIMIRLPDKTILEHGKKEMFLDFIQRTHDSNLTDSRHDDEYYDV